MINVFSYHDLAVFISGCLPDRVVVLRTVATVMLGLALMHISLVFVTQFSQPVIQFLRSVSKNVTP